MTDEGVRALWKMVNFSVPQAPAVDGEADLLGVAHCWQSTGPAASTAASRELRNEIHNEEDELFRDIFLEARGLQALQASQEAQQQRMARLQQRRLPPSDGMASSATSADNDVSVEGHSSHGASGEPEQRLPYSRPPS